MKSLITLFCLVLTSPTFGGEEFKSSLEYERSELELISHSSDLVNWRLSMNQLYQEMKEHYDQERGLIDARDLVRLRKLTGELNDQHLKRFSSNSFEISDFNIVQTLINSLSQLFLASRQ